MIAVVFVVWVAMAVGALAVGVRRLRVDRERQVQAAAAQREAQRLAAAVAWSRWAADHGMPASAEAWRQAAAARRAP